MRAHTLAAVAAGLASGLAAACISVGQPESKRQPLSEQDLQKLIATERERLAEREKRIDEELAALDREKLPDSDWAKKWAGTYYVGDGLGMNVVVKLAPKSGLTYTWHGCLGLYDANHGDIVQATKSEVVIRLAIPTGSSGFDFISEKLYFVPWGDRRYLVPERQMLEMVNGYNEGGYARASMYSIPRRVEGQVSRGFEDAPPGRPQLPPEYAKLIIEKPLALTITAISEKPEREVTRGVGVVECSLGIKGGEDQGVFVGMEFAFKRGTTYGTIKIERVDATTCSGKLTIFGSLGEKPTLPTVGTVLDFPGAQPDEEPRPAAPNKPD